MITPIESFALNDWTKPVIANASTTIVSFEFGLLAAVGLRPPAFGLRQRPSQRTVIRGANRE